MPPERQSVSEGGERECKGSAFWGNTQGGGAKKYVFLAYVCFFLYLCSPI